MAHRPEWQLPPGVSRGVWHYTRANYIAERYDDYFAGNRLFEFDRQVLDHYFRRPGPLVDLGCGTGRVLVELARRGYWGLGVDLSPAMLRIAAEKAALARIAHRAGILEPPDASKCW